MVTTHQDSAVYKQSLDLLNDIKNKTESGIDPAVRRHVMQKAHLNIQQISADREQVFSKIKLLSELIQQSASQVTRPVAHSLVPFLPAC
jgi:hypothetical protein